MKSLELQPSAWRWLYITLSITCSTLQCTETTNHYHRVNYTVYSDMERFMYLYSILALHPQLFLFELSASKLIVYFKFICTCLKKNLSWELSSFLKFLIIGGTWPSINWVVYTCMFWGSFDVIDILNSKLLLQIVYNLINCKQLSSWPSQVKITGSSE